MSPTKSPGVTKVWNVVLIFYDSFNRMPYEEYGTFRLTEIDATDLVGNYR
jgi:hypothetical protein